MKTSGSVLGSIEYPVPLSGEAQLLASLALLGPFLGQGVPEVGQGDVSDAEDDADLAVLDLAEPAAPRPLHPDRSIALLGEGRGIDDEPGVGAADRAGDLMVQFVAGRLVVPGHLTEEPLDGLAVSGPLMSRKAFAEDEFVIFYRFELFKIVKIRGILNF